MLRCHPGSVRALRAALAHARAGRYASARLAVDACLEAQPHDAAGHLAAAGIRYVARDHQGALDALDVARTLDPSILADVVDDRFRYAGMLGWDQDVRESLEDAMAREPERARWPILAMRLFTRADALDRAIEMAARALSLSPSPRVEMERAHLLVEVGRLEEARDAAERALGAAPPTEAAPYLRAAADVFLAADASERARAILEGLLAHDVAVAEELAELALARGDAAAARRLASRETEGASRIRGAAAMLEGALEEAVACLDAALAVDAGDYRAWALRAEVAHRLGDPETAHAALDRATMLAPGYYVAARVLRLLVVAVAEGDETIALHRTEELRDAVVEMVPAAAPAFASDRRGPIVAALEEALARMAGSRAVPATYLDPEGRVRRLRTSTGVRHASRHALQLIRTLPKDETLAALDRVCLAHPDASLPVCHRGELHLWLGDLEAAQRDLWAAIGLHRWTRWAYIGLTGVELERGRPANALMASVHGVDVMGGTVGPAVYVYRGEARLRAGDLDGARGDLEQVLVLTPTRVAAWVLLAICAAGQGDGSAFDRAWAHLDRYAPGLLSTAARAASVELYPDPGDPGPSTEERVVALEAALRCMRGNRSTSCATFFDPEGRLRFVQPLEAGAPAAHDRDDVALQRVEGVLTSGLRGR